MLEHSKISAWRIIEGRAFVINTKDSTLHELDGTGTFIWKTLEKGAGIPSIVNKLCVEYDVTREAAQKDVSEFVAALIKKGLIRNDR